MKKIVTILTISTSLLTACQTVPHVPMNKQDRAVIKSVYIKPEMKTPEKMFEYRNSNAIAPALLGPVGVTLAYKASQDAATSLKATLDKQNIDIRKIVYRQWNKQLSNDHVFKIANSSDDTVLTTDIISYGLTIRHGFTSDYVPALGLNAKLTKNNKVLWQDSEILLPLTSGLPRYKMEQILSNPNNVAIMWDKAAEHLVAKMIVDMNKAV
jgi:hypothetical protein